MDCSLSVLTSNPLKGGEIVMSENNNNDSWLLLGLIMALDKLIKTPREEAEAAKKKELNPLKEAEANGQDVCWDCETIEPERCPWGCCISGKSPCGASYGGRCYIHDDD